MSETFNVKPRETLKKITQDINAAIPLDGMHFELLSEGHMQAMVDFAADYFSPDTALSKYWDILGADDSLTEVIPVRFSRNLSLILIDKSSDDIIGTIAVHAVPSRQLNIHEIKYEKIKTVLKFICQKFDEMNVCNRFDVNISQYVADICVRPDFRERGLGCKLVEAALMFFSQCAVEMPCITGVGTSEQAQRIFEKCGFETLDTAPYADYKENGEVVFNNKGKNVSMKIYGKQL